MKKFHNYVCDCCHHTIPTMEIEEYCTAVTFTSKNKKTTMHFCNKDCKLVFFKGKKYLNNRKKMQNTAALRAADNEGTLGGTDG